MLTKRTNILFDEHLWTELTALAQKQRISVGELIRKAVKEYYDLHDRNTITIQNACAAIESARKQQKGTVDYKALINYGRKI